jgi:hypothetical protein
MTGRDVDGAAGREHPIATLCGSMRLHRDMLTVAAELTRQGQIVLLPLPIMDDRSLHCASPITDDELAALHRAKIDMADLVVIVTQEQRHVVDTDSAAWYFGESTRAEWAYAESLGKVIKVVRVQRHEGRDGLVWIDTPVVFGGQDEGRPAMAAGARRAGRRPGRRQPRRVVSAHTFRID